MRKYIWFGTATIILVVLLYSFWSAFGQNPIDYNTQVKPILNKRCISCHGGVRANGGFSLMTREFALSKTESGEYAIVQGDAQVSEVVKRILEKDPEKRMPLDGPPLTDEEIKILSKWIDQGAKWGKHWSYNSIEISEEDKEAKSISDIAKLIDKYIDQKKKEAGFNPHEQATKPELLRRISFAITGLPPKSEIGKYYLSGETSTEELIDELLSHPTFGEKWASMWLDIARYADSKGFERDPYRNIWPYRDYVIQSLNQGLPYDSFLIEQLAGDLLPSPTEKQLVATGFHRNTLTNDEGGTDNEEYRIRAVMDRTSTTWEGLMGTTMACVQCHGHPYDPFPHKDFYESMAFFNNTRDYDTYADYPRLRLLDSMDHEKLTEISNWIEKKSDQITAQQFENLIKTGLPARYSIETDQLVNAAHYDTKFLGFRKNGSARLKEVDLSGVDALFIRAISPKGGGRLIITIDSLNGITIVNKRIKNTKGKYEILQIPINQSTGIHDIYFSYNNPLLKSSDRRGLTIDWFHFGNALPQAHSKKEKNYQKEYFDLLNGTGNHALIMSDNPPENFRTTYLFDRGNFLATTEKVSADVPDILVGLEGENSKSRLDFANWMVRPDHPLTSRTFVNRVWHQLFGRGIVETTEDLGSQGALPSHPELLDGLAYHWMNTLDWNIKELIKVILLTESYQQSSVITQDMKEKDPYNILMSRGPRIRLSAEEIRDQALAVSGLISQKMYGPPVMPYQPPNIWRTPYNNESWKISEGEDRYRRALYTMVKRSSTYPSFETFDLANRNVCNSRRINTNTPLQALVTLNDSTFIEAAIALGQRMDSEGGNNLADKVKYGYELCASKPITPEKEVVLVDLYKESYDRWIAKSEPDQSHKKSLALVANVLLNLDEVLNN